MTDSPIRHQRSSFLRRMLVVVAVAYPAALIVLVLLLRYVGERWWVTSVGLYAPRFPFALPLPFLVAALGAWGPRKWLWTQLVAAWVVLFPLLGFVWYWPTTASDDHAGLRVMTCNVNSGYSGYEHIAAEVLRHSPDIVLFQEANIHPAQLAERVRPALPHTEVSTQFVTASRYPIVETIDPERILFRDTRRSPRYLRHVLDTPIGPVTVFNIHPLSPRGAFSEMRGEGLRKEILSGRIFSGSAAESLRHHSDLRAAQVRRFSGEARAATTPVILAGDTNLPSLSPVLEDLAGFRDGFIEAGWGLGYTYPKRDRWPLWMRLDRILTNDALAFTRFSVLDWELSDHLCVLADVVDDR